MSANLENSVVPTGLKKASFHSNPQKRQCQRMFKFSSVQSLSCVRLFVTPWIAARQASLSITNSQSLPKPMSIESVMPFSYLILCHPLLLLPSIISIIMVFSSEFSLCIRWPKYWSYSFGITPSMNIQCWFPLGLTGLISLLSKRLSRVFFKTAFQKVSVLWYSVFYITKHFTSICDYWKNHSLTIKIFVSMVEA